MADDSDQRTELETEIHSLFERRPYLKQIFSPETVVAELEMLNESPVRSQPIELEDGLLTIAQISTLAEDCFVRRYPGALSEQEVALRVFKENPLEFQLGNITVDTLEVLKLSGI